MTWRQSPGRMAPLAAFGRRICIVGPSNSGKSTLAHALARKLAVPAVHLDVLRHLPNTNWVMRPEAEFVALHDQAIAGDGWVMDGNYSVCIAGRFRRATGIIWLDTSTASNLARYFRRTLFERQRHGALSGGQDSLKRMMIAHILLTQPKNRPRMAARLAATPLPQLQLRSMREVRRLHDAWGLDRS